MALLIDRAITCNFPPSSYQDLCRNRISPGNRSDGHEKLKAHVCVCIIVFLHFLCFSTHFEKLDSDTGEHEVQQHGDQDDVSDGLHSYKHTLDHVLQSQTWQMEEMENQPSLKPAVQLETLTGHTFSPLALLMALKGRSTLNTLRIFTTEMALDLTPDTHTNVLIRAELREEGGTSLTRGLTYSMPMESRDTLTTSRSRMLKEFLQKEPLWRMAPYVVIWKHTVDSSDVLYVYLSGSFFRNTVYNF